MSPLKVVVTGAGGYISNALLPAFSERYDLTLLDLSKETKNGWNVLVVDYNERIIYDPIERIYKETK